LENTKKEGPARWPAPHDFIFETAFSELNSLSSSVCF